MHNATATLSRCIEAILASQPAPDAVVVVDDASTDESPRLAESYGVRVLRTGDRPVGPGVARNLGVASLETDFVCFVDSDVEVAPDAIDRLVQPLRDDPSIGASFGSYDDDPPDRAVASLYANLRHHHTHQQADRDAVTFWAGCGVVRRIAFDAVDGFDPAYARPSIEDIDLGDRLHRAGWAIRLVPEARSKHWKAWTVKSLWKTDIFSRAVPWTRLLAQGEGVRNDLNAQWSQRLSALLAHGVWVTLLSALVCWPIALATPVLIAAWGWSNRGLLVLLYRRGGWRAAIGGTALHMAYHAYASVVFVGVTTRERWRSNGRPMGRASRMVTGTVVALLAVASLVCATLVSLDAELVAQTATKFEKHPEEPRFSATDVGQMQVRAVMFLAGYLGLAGLLTAVGPEPCRAALVDAGKLMRRLRRAGPLVWGCLIAATLMSAFLAAAYLGQVMRLDESTSFLNYGTRPAVVALALLESTNNHVLFSLAMRGSVAAFGDEPWAIRLPAYLAAVASLPLVFIAGRRYVGGTAALIAALAAAGCVYQVDLSTNARGYPFVQFAVLGLMALLPDAARGRAAGRFAFVGFAALGAWSVPIMIYPFAVAAAWLVLDRVAKDRGRGLANRLGGAAGLIVSVGVLVLLLYGPALVVSGAAEQGVGKQLAKATEQGVWGRVDDALGNLVFAWHQWAFPLGSTGSWVLLVALAFGVMAALWRGGRARRLVLAWVIGVGGVYVATGLAAPPWWSLTFVFPLLTWFAAVPLGWGIDRWAKGVRGSRRLRRRVGVAVACLAAGASAAITLTSDYPRAFPHYIGLREAPAVADYLQRQHLLDGVVVARGVWANAINYQVYDATGQTREVWLDHEAADPAITKIAYVTEHAGNSNHVLDAFLDRGCGGTEEVRFEEARLLILETDPADADDTTDRRLPEP